jgi:hypothetical protein
MITLSDGTTTVHLDDALYWEDEHWTPVTQTVNYSLSGALIRQVSSVLAGRPITLKSLSSDTALVSWETRQQLRYWAADKNVVLTLTFSDQESYPVAFRHQDGALEFTPFGELAVRGPGSLWAVLIRLMVTEQ